MKAVLAAEIGEQLVVTLTMTKKELEQAMADPQLLLRAVSGACGEKTPHQQEEAVSADCASPAECFIDSENSAPGEDDGLKEKEALSSGGSPFSYKNIVLNDLSGSKEDIIDRAVKLLIARSEIPVNMAEIESEADYCFKAAMQSMRYDVLFGRAPESEMQADPEELMAEIREDLIFEQKENYIYKKIIELEGFEVSPEELYEEAEAMARRQATTLEMVQSFFGKDLTGLAGDVRKRKARDFLYSLVSEGK